MKLNKIVVAIITLLIVSSSNAAMSFRNVSAVADSDNQNSDTKHYKEPKYHDKKYMKKKSSPKPPPTSNDPIPGFDPNKPHKEETKKQDNDNQ